MNTKPSLRMDEAIVRKARIEARRRGTSVFRTIAEFIESIGSRPHSEKAMRPTTAPLVGILKGQEISEDDYKAHLREKYV